MLHSSSLCVRALKWRNVCYEAASKGVDCYNVYYCYAYKLEENKHVAYQIKANDVANVLAGAHEKVHGLLVLGIVYEYSSVHFTR